MVDEDSGEPLAGASLKLISGTDSAARPFADAQGKVSRLNLVPQQRIQVRVTYVGYEPVDSTLVPDPKKSEIVIAMKTRSNLHDNLVVTGYTSRKRSCRLRCGSYRVSYESSKAWSSGDQAAGGLHVFPNPAPAGSLVRIRLPRQSGGAVQLLNLAGQVIHQQAVRREQYPVIAFQLPPLPGGTYVLRLAGGQGTGEGVKVVVAGSANSY